MALGDIIARWVEKHVITEKNLERLLKYYWIISTFRIGLGLAIMFLILVAGYKFGDLLPK